MYTVLDQIAGAVETLTGKGGNPKERHLKGFNEFWHATRCSVEWPPDIVQRLLEVCFPVLSRGKAVETIEAMDPETVLEVTAQLAKDIAAFAADLEKALASRS